VWKLPLYPWIENTNHPFVIQFYYILNWKVAVGWWMLLVSWLWIFLKKKVLFFLLRNVSIYDYFLFTSQFLLFLLPKKERKNLKNCSCIFIFFVERFHHLATKEGVSKEGLLRTFFGNFWPKSPYFKIESSQLPYLVIGFWLVC
jgi:hypothetical protein